MKLCQLTKAIQLWAKERGIDTLKPSGQYMKFLEEAGELGKALMDHNEIEVQDALGDVFVTLVTLSLTSGYDLSECVNLAYNEIKDRKGKVVDGVFVKEDPHES